MKDAGRIRGMVDIVAQAADRYPVHIVCSAMKGITDDLIRIARMAEDGDGGYKQIIEEIWTRQLDAVDDLFEPDGLGDDAPRRYREGVMSQLQGLLKELREISHGVFLVRECSPRSLDLVMSFGERMNNSLIAAYMNSIGIPAFFVDARQLVKTDTSYGRGEVNFAKTNDNIRRFFNQHEDDGIGVITGFVASTDKGITTTLGRNGSDYSASIFGAALGASDIEIWTDVDGVLEADPRVVPEAAVIDDLGIDEAMEMSYFGAEVLHPYTMLPAVETGIPIWIKNTMNPSVRGTRIGGDAPQREASITGIASIPRVAMINVVGGGMVGARGIASKIFLALARSEVNIIMISQASSEHSICVVLREDEAETAETCLRQDLAHELRIRQLQTIQVIRGLEVVSIIGSGMRGRPGVSGRLFQSLGRKGINVQAIAQGSSEMNISFVISSKDHNPALQSIHQAFFQSGIN